MLWLVVAVKVLLEALVSFGFNAIPTLTDFATTTFLSSPVLHFLPSPSTPPSLSAPSPVSTLSSPMETVEPVMETPVDAAPSRASLLPEGFPNVDYLHLLDPRDLHFLGDDPDSFSFDAFSSSSSSFPRSEPLFSSWARDLALLIAVAGLVVADFLARKHRCSPPPPSHPLRFDSLVETASPRPSPPLGTLSIRVQASSQTSPPPSPSVASSAPPSRDSTTLPPLDSTLPPSLDSPASIFTGSDAVASLNTTAFIDPPRDAEAEHAALTAYFIANHLPRAATTFVPTSASDPFINWGLWNAGARRMLEVEEDEEGDEGGATQDGWTSSMERSGDEVGGGDEDGMELDGSVSMRTMDFGLSSPTSSSAAPGTFFVPTSADDVFIDWPAYNVQRALRLAASTTTITLASSSVTTSLTPSTLTSGSSMDMVSDSSDDDDDASSQASDSSVPSLFNSDMDVDSCSSSSDSGHLHYPTSSTPDASHLSPSSSSLQLRSPPPDLVSIRSPATIHVDRLLRAMQKESWARQEERRNDIFTIDEENEDL